MHAPIPDDRLLMVYNGQVFVVDRHDVRNHQSHYLYGEAFLQVPKTAVDPESVRFHPFQPHNVFFMYLDTHTTREAMEQDPIPFVRRQNRFLRGDCAGAVVIMSMRRVGTNTDKVIIDYFVSNRVIQNVLLGNREPKAPILANLLQRNEATQIICNTRRALRDLTHYPPQLMLGSDERLDGLFVEGFGLFDYQKRDILWMTDVETRVAHGDNALEYSFQRVYYVLDGKLAVVNGALFPSSMLNTSQSATVHPRFFGGNLISEMGLGKTITMLSHIVSDSRDSPLHAFVQYDDTCNYMFKRGQHAGAFCHRPQTEGSVMCSTHRRAPFIDKTKTVYRGIDDLRLTDFYIRTPNGKTSVYTNATLIVCPGHLCDMWVREAVHRFKQRVRIVSIATRDQYKGVTFGDIFFADVVVTSYSMLTSVSPTVDPYFSPDTSVLDVLQSKTWSFNTFTWKRVVHDECHEVRTLSNSKRVMDALDSLSYRVWWNVTGTPFATGVEGLLDTLRYTTNITRLTQRTGPENAMDPLQLMQWGMTRSGNGIVDVVKHLYRRNTRDSVRDELSRNLITENTVLLQFTPEERSLYDSYVAGRRGSLCCDFLIRLCCHVDLCGETRTLVKQCKTLEEIQAAILEHNASKIRDLDDRINITRTEIQTLEQHLTSTSDDESIRSRLGNLRRMATNDTKAIASLQRTQTYLQTVIRNLQQPDVCPICLEDINDETTTLTKCGHKYCWECVQRLFETRANGTVSCPQCKVPVRTTDVYAVTRAQGTHSSHGEVEGLVREVRSTKIGNVLHYLQCNQSEKCIVFSQWDELLHKVGYYLQAHGVQVLFMNGTVYQRKRAIDNFVSNADYTCMLLSSRNAASGMNLTAASTIIFLEPVYGSMEYRLSIENQAIGRADRIGQNKPIKVLRFAIADTIEEDILNDAVNENELRPLRA